MVCEGRAEFKETLSQLQFQEEPGVGRTGEEEVPCLGPGQECFRLECLRVEVLSHEKLIDKVCDN